MMRRRFKDLSRPEQRRNLLMRLHRQRREIEQYLRDLAYWNSLQRSRAGDVLPEDPEMVALLATIDQSIRQVRDSR